MHRIDSSTAQKDKFGPGKNGFTGGNPQTGVPATALNAAFFDSVQEEISGVIEAAGIALDTTQNNQLQLAISKIITGAIPPAPVTSVNGKTGAVNLSAIDVGAVAQVNGKSPDGSGNVTIDIPGQAVSSVNGKTGAVTLSAADVGATPAGGYSPQNPPPYPVLSVNGQTGNVTVTASTVGLSFSNVGANQWALSTDSTMRILGITGIACSSNTSVTVTLARAFPSSILAISGSFTGSGGNDIDSYWTATIINSGSFTLHSQNCTGTWSFIIMGI